MKSIKVRVAFFIIFIFSVFLNGNSVKAFGVNDFTGTAVTDSEAVNFGNQIITVITTIGIVISVIVLIVIGIKYMIGSIEEKAEYKKSMKPYIAGAICVFMASTIASLIYNLVGNL